MCVSGLFAQGYSLQLNGTSQYADCGTSSNFQLTNNLTIEAWIYPTDFQTSMFSNTIAAKVDWTSYNTYGWSFRYGSSSRTLDFNMSGGGNTWVDCKVNSVLTLNTWQHVAATYNGSVVKLYVNGAEVASLNATSSIPYSSTNLYIGSINRSGDMRCLKGRIDEVRIWKVARTGSEIASNRYKTVTNANLIASYRMTDGSGTTLSDNSGNGYNGNLIGSPEWSTNIPYDYSAVTTQDMVSVGSTTATASGTITTLGIPNPTQYGHCWSTTNPPTVANTASQLGTATVAGAYTSNITNLTPNTTYYIRSYVTNAVSTEYGSTVSFITKHAAAGQTEIISPVTNSINVDRTINLIWNAPIGSIVDGYLLSLGTDNPPTNILNGVDLGNALSHHITDNLDYGTIYYWRVSPYNNSGATTGDICNFRTIDQIQVPIAPINTSNGTINPTVTIAGLVGDINVQVTADWATPDTGYSSNWLTYTIKPTGFSITGHTISVQHGLSTVPASMGYRILPNTTWNTLVSTDPEILSWDDYEISFVVPNSKADGDLQIAFPTSEDPVLPVTLTSFNATFNAQNFVTLSWVTQSEMNVVGYNIYRNNENKLDSATCLNQLIQAGNTSQEQTYTFRDNKITSNGIYYYWLHRVDYDGVSTFHGPITVMVTLSGGNSSAPTIPLVTEISSIYPNPMTRDAKITYSVDNQCDVAISVYNSKGRLVKRFQEGVKSPNTYNIYWDGKDNVGNESASGMYIIKMQAGGVTSVKKAVVIK